MPSKQTVSDLCQKQEANNFHKWQNAEGQNVEDKLLKNLSQIVKLYYTVVRKQNKRILSDIVQSPQKNYSVNSVKSEQVETEGNKLYIKFGKLIL